MSGAETLDDPQLHAAPEPQRLRAEQEIARLHAQNRNLRHEINSLHNLGAIIGSSPTMLRVLDSVSRVAVTDATVLITGETGTGKELIARTIHGASRRAEQPFVKLDCAALPAEALEVELFGERPDAQTAPAGSFALAAGGSIFLDEIAELRYDLQTRLLRLLLEQEALRADSITSRAAEVRIVAATNRDLVKAVRSGSFREDLYYRLNVFPVELPPLRAHAEDIPELVQFFLQKYAPRYGRRVDAVDPDTLANLERYPWPGNIRELEHLIERALVLNNTPILKIAPELLAVMVPQERAEVAGAATGMHRLMTLPTASPVNLDDTENTGLHHVQREHILRVLNATRWVIEGNSGAALKLGMKPATLRHRMKKLGIARATATS